ncbi:unnamed protein product [Arabidopsis lyrata]|nr:unnamed protein product [Arabidopsis lyrata]
MRLHRHNPNCLIEKKKEEKEWFSWIVACLGLGFAPGVVFGLTMGYIVASYKMRGSLILLAEEGTGAPEHVSSLIDHTPLSDLKYTLYGVIVHVGELISSGHYYYYVRTSSAWYCLDDYRVFKVSEKAVLDAKAYIMLYALDRQETSNGAEMSQINTADDAEREKWHTILLVKGKEEKCSVEIMQLKDLFWEWGDFLSYVSDDLNSIGRKRKWFVEVLAKKKRKNEHKRKMRKKKKEKEKKKKEKEKKKNAKEEKKNID